MTASQPDADALLATLRGWSAEGQEQAAAALERARDTAWRPFYCGVLTCDGKPHGNWRWPHGRGDQHPPRTRWNTWIELSGRGSGKTRSGAEWTHRMTTKTGRIALIAPTAADCRDTLVEGESGLLATASPTNPCTYKSSNRRITWHNGARATLFSADTPDRLRGPQHGAAWVDEACFYGAVQDVWDNLLFGLRLGQRPQVHITTTPKPRPWLRTLLRDPSTAISTASTYANIDNLAPTFRDAVLARYEGTRLGRQEIHAEVLEDIEGALWTAQLIDADRVASVATCDSVVVSVDPPGSSGEGGAEAGIVVVGRIGNQGYVLADLSGRMTPQEWGTTALTAYHYYSADAIVMETNYGGDMVKHTIRTLPGSRGVPIRGVVARRNKQLRAEPVVSLYEQHRIHHVGVHTVLEGQMTEWVPGETAASPDRLDALVHGFTSLLVTSPPSSLGNPARSSVRFRSSSAATG